MKQVLRTIGKADYSCQLLKVNSQVNEETEVEVEWEGRILIIVGNGRSWVPKDSADEPMTKIAEAIGKAIVLRYRI